MGHAFRLSTAAETRAAIAHHILGVLDEAVQVGSISLRPHQVEGCTQVENALSEFGGALLCDDVGMGKTYIAIAAARRFNSVLVVAPAALRSMWSGALERAKTQADLITFERLSRRGNLPSLRAYDFVIVDEAQHVRNASTRRYRALSRMLRGAQTLLLTATPIHNHRRDLVSLLALFLGRRAGALTREEISRCLIRRADLQVKANAGIPRIQVPVYHEIGDDTDVVAAIRALPPPLPVREGGIAADLVARGLIHQWASSEAALTAALRRRLGRGYALLQSLRAGTLPTERELSTWTYGDGAVQLGFAELLAEPVGSPRDMLDCLSAHIDALEQVRGRTQKACALDTRRAEVVVEILRSHPGARIVAFAQYEETVMSLFRRLQHIARVALLTSSGGRIASGSVSRDVVLGQLGPDAGPVSPACAIDLLLTTDMMSEGVNLQRAGVVIHLDVPWTSARMEQRVGRLARAGSNFESVSVYTLRPPLSARQFLESEKIVLDKWISARAAVGVASRPPFHTGNEGPGGNEAGAEGPVPALVECLRSILRSWVRASRIPAVSFPVAAVRGTQNGFLAAVTVGGERMLLASRADVLYRDLERLMEVARDCTTVELAVHPDTVTQAIRQVENWARVRALRTTAGAGDTSEMVARPRLLSRLDAIIAHSPLHLRTARAQRVALARAIATGSHGAAVESMLEAAQTAELSDDELLDAILSIGGTEHRPRPRSDPDTFVIHALIMLQSDAVLPHGALQEAPHAQCPEQPGDGNEGDDHH